MTLHAFSRALLATLAASALLSGCAEAGFQAEAAADKARQALHHRFDKTEPGWTLSIERPPSPETLASERRILGRKPIPGALIEARQSACWLDEAPTAPLFGSDPCAASDAMEAEPHWGLLYFPARFLIIYRKEFRQGRPGSDLDLETRAVALDMRALAAGLETRGSRIDVAVSEFAGSDAGVVVNYAAADPKSKGAFDFSEMPYANQPPRELARALWTKDDRGVALGIPTR